MNLGSFEGSILFLLSDPFNQHFIERMLQDIPYEKDYGEYGERILYQVRNDPLYGCNLIRNLKDMIREDTEIHNSKPVEEPRRLIVVLDYTGREFSPDKYFSDM